MSMQIPQVDSSVLQAARDAIESEYEMVQIQFDESGATGTLALPVLDLLDLGSDENPSAIVDSWPSRINAWYVCFEFLENLDVPYASAIVRLHESGEVDSCGVTFGPTETVRVEFLKKMSRAWARDESRRRIHSFALAIDNIGLLSWTDVDSESGYRAMLVDPLPGPIDSSEDVLDKKIRQIQEWIARTVMKSGPVGRSGGAVTREELIHMIHEALSGEITEIFSKLQTFALEEIRREVAKTARFALTKGFSPIGQDSEPSKPHVVVSLGRGEVDNFVSLNQRVEYAIAASLNGVARFASDRVMSIIGESSATATNAND